MAGYFTQLPLVEYPDLVANNNTVVLTNILTRSAFLQEIVENTALFYDYALKDGETAEIIADKLYGDAKRFWIVLLFNKMMNPYYEFPLISDQLNSLIENKYGISVTESQSTIHHYELHVNRSVLLNGIIQSTSDDVYTISEQMAQTPEGGIAIDNPSLPAIADTSIEVETKTESFGGGITVTSVYSYHAVSIYNYEAAENEKRRTIKLLDKGYVVGVENEFRRLMRDGN